MVLDVTSLRRFYHAPFCFGGFCFFFCVRCTPFFKVGDIIIRKKADTKSQETQKKSMPKVNKV